MKTSNLNIGEEILKALDMKGLKKADLARLLGVKPQAIDYMTKRKSVDTDTLFKLSKVLDYDFFSLYQRILYQADFDGIKTEKAKIIVEIELDKDDVIKLNLKNRIAKSLGKT